MNSIELAFDRPLLLLLFFPVMGLILLPFFLLPRHRRKGVKRILPLVLHGIIALLLCLILSGFSIVKVSDKQAVLLLIDLSYSTEPVQNQIEEKAEELLSLIDENLPVGAVVFGKDQQYLLQLTDTDRTLSKLKPIGEATDLEQALDYALSLAPKEDAFRIILLSDGKQTAGQAENAAYRLAESGVRVDALYFDSTLKSSPEMQLSSFSASEGVWKGETFTLSAQIKSNTQGQARLMLFEEDTLLEQRSVAVEKGSTPLLFEFASTQGGMRSFRLELHPENGQDTFPENNASSVFLRVSDKQRLLILSDTTANGNALSAVLGEDFETTVKKAHEAPRNLSDLCKFDGIVLLNADYYSLPAAFNNVISEYVNVYGRSLTVAGGKDTFMFGNMSDTVLEELSPVDFKLEESPEGSTVALMLVLDCSRSMNATYMALAKQGAIQSLKALNSNDYAGVISFNSEATLQSPLVYADADGKEKLTHVISAIQTGSGTFYTEALNLAAKELSTSDASVKHILFLSDGQPSDGGYYDAVIKANEQGITVSTIGLDYASTVLDYMAYYGKGRYHYVASADDLPDIMLSEAEQARINPTIVGQFGTQIKKQSAITEGLDVSALPALSGYLGTTAKENAQVYLTTDEGHPLLAVAEQGFGQVCCFTSDLYGDWSAGWFADPQGQELIRRAFTFVRPKVQQESTLVVKAEQNGSNLAVTVNTQGVSYLNTVTVLLEDENGRITEQMLTLKMQGLYTGQIPVSYDSLYRMTVVEQSPTGQELDRLESAVAVNWCGEYDAFAEGGQPLLTTICNLTGGSLLKEAKEGASIALSPVKSPKTLTVLFVLLCGLLFIIDVALRRLRLKDLTEHFYEWQELWQAKKKN